MSNLAAHTPRIALVYDWTNTAFGGAEHILRALHRLYPEAPLYTAVYDEERATWAKAWKIQPSWLQRIPGASRRHRWLAPLLPIAFETFDFSNFDVVISITSFAAKGILTSPNQLHICYLLTPPRYLWSHQRLYLQTEHPLNPTGGLRAPFFRYLQWWDRAAAARPDTYVTISDRVSTRCQEYYHRDPAQVIYPPLSSEFALRAESEFAKKSSSPMQFPYFLVVARLVRYKKIDLAVQACINSRKHLVVVGQGPEEKRLRHLARKASDLIHFIPNLPSEDLPRYYQHCTAFLMPGEEDFGITGLEAWTMGRPVIVHKSSGVAEFAQEDQNALLLPDSHLESMMRALQRSEDIAWQPEEIRQTTRALSEAVFRQRFDSLVTKLWHNYRRRLPL